MSDDQTPRVRRWNKNSSIATNLSHLAFYWSDVWFLVDDTSINSFSFHCCFIALVVATINLLSSYFRFCYEIKHFDLSSRCSSYWPGEIAQWLFDEIKSPWKPGIYHALICWLSQGLPCQYWANQGNPLYSIQSYFFCLSLSSLVITMLLLLLIIHGKSIKRYFFYLSFTLLSIIISLLMFTSDANL